MRRAALSLVRVPGSRHLQGDDADLRLIGAQPPPESAGKMEQRVPAILEDQRSFRRNAMAYSLGGQDGEADVVNEVADVDRRPAVEMLLEIELGVFVLVVVAGDEDDESAAVPQGVV